MYKARIQQIHKIHIDPDHVRGVRKINDSNGYLLYRKSMIKLLESGNYRLIETPKQTKILVLKGKKVFAWINAGKIGEILVASHKPHKTDYTLAIGRYRLYEVKNEPAFIDLLHLELLIGDGIWQGYVLPTGLPEKEKRKSQIIPTDEIITKSHSYSLASSASSRSSLL